MPLHWAHAPHACGLFIMLMSTCMHWAHAPHGDYNMHVGCSMERGRHSGTAEGRRVRNRPCDVAHRSEVCGTLEDLTVRVWRRLRSVCYMVPVGRWGLAGAARGSTERSHHPHAPVRAYPCLCRRTTGACRCTGDEGAVRVHRVDRGRGSGARCAHATCGRYRVRERGHVLPRARARPVSPRPAGASTGARPRHRRWSAEFRRGIVYTIGGVPERAYGAGGLGGVCVHHTDEYYSILRRYLKS